MLNLKRFLALSRTPHALLDLAAPGLAALLCLGGFPAMEIVVLGLITAFAGYTAVYALNDLVDYRVDRETTPPQVPPAAPDAADLDSLFARHPLAQGLISYRSALLWTLGWATLAVMGAWLLNPWCLAVFFLAAGLEIVYCLLLRVTWLRAVVSGMVKTAGPLAAVLAVEPAPASGFVMLLFLWLFSWEIGGQNVPNDLSDVEADRKLKAQTIPVRFGNHAALWIILGSLLLASALSVLLAFLVPGGVDYIFLAGVVFAGIFFLIAPALRLYLSHDPQMASPLFNRASYYPLALLLCLTFSFLF